MKKLFLFLCATSFICPMQKPGSGTNKLENPFDSDKQMISFLDGIRCGTINAIEEDKRIILQFSNYKDEDIQHRMPLAHAQSALHYISTLGQLRELQSLRVELIKDEQTMKVEPDTYPGLPKRITDTQQKIATLNAGLNRLKALPDINAYPTPSDEEYETEEDKEPHEQIKALCINKLEDAKTNKDMKYICRLSINSFYHFWSGTDLLCKQTTKDHLRDFEQVKKNRTAFFEAIEGLDGQKLLEISASSIIKKPTLSTLATVDKIIWLIEHNHIGSPANSDDEIY